MSRIAPSLFQACNAVIVYNGNINVREIVLSKNCYEFLVVMEDAKLP